MTADRDDDPITRNNLENLNGYKIILHRSNPQLVITASVILLRKIHTSFAESSNSSWECGLCIYILNLISWTFTIGFFWIIIIIIIVTTSTTTVYLTQILIFIYFIFLFLYRT